jgi:hypothetical protein
LLQALPRAKASSRFTSDVLQRLRTESVPNVRPALWLRYATAAMLLVCLVAGVRGAMRHAHEERIEALRTEHQRIETELYRVKQAAEKSQPVMVLEDGGGTRVVVDLGTEPAARPVSLDYD